jgi:hypothetical protein
MTTRTRNATEEPTNVAGIAELNATLEAERATVATLQDRATTAIATLENGWTNWATLTAAQKDATLKLSVRVVATLARLVLRKLDN